MCGIVLDFSKGQCLEFGDEFAEASGVVQQRAQAFGLFKVSIITPWVMASGFTGFRGVMVPTLSVDV